MWRKDYLKQYAFFLTPILLILSFYYSFVSFFAFVPFFVSLKFLKSKKIFLNVALESSIAFMPFFLFLYVGLLKGIYVYNHVPFLLAFGMYFGLCIYQLLYTIAPFYLVNKLNISFLYIPFLYIAFEFLRSLVLYGDPIGNVSLFVYNLPFFIKDTSWFGSYFIGLKLLFINIAIYYILVRNFKKSIVILSVVLLLLFFVTLPPKKGTTTKSIALVQGNISQSQKWDETSLLKNLSVYVNATKNTKADIIAWPESAYPFLFSESDFNYILGNYNNAIIFGAETKRNNHYYNSAVFFDKKRYEFYDKHELVPFAEFIPLKRYLSFIPTVTKFGSFTHGKRFTIFDVKNLKIATIICYEEDFPKIARRFKDLGANLLIVITNDAWFSKTPTFNLFYRDDFYRALENNLYVARDANTGFSMIVSPNGQMITSLKPYTFGILKQTITFNNEKKTFFDKIGYLFPYFNLYFSGILLLLLIRKKRRH